MEQKTNKYTAESYLTRWTSRQSYYAIMATRSRWLYYVIQTIIILGAAITPFLINTVEVSKVWPTVLSAIVAVAAALNSFWRPKESWHTYYMIFDGMRREKIQFDMNLGKYKRLSPEEAFELFMNESDKLMGEEVKKTFGSPEPKQEQK